MYKQNWHNFDDEIYEKKLNKLRILLNLMFLSIPIFFIFFILLSLLNLSCLSKIAIVVYFVFECTVACLIGFFRCPRCNNHLNKFFGGPVSKCEYCGLPINYRYNSQKPDSIDS